MELLAVESYPNSQIAYKKFFLSLPYAPENEKQEAKKFILEKIDESSMAPFYKVMCEDLGWSLDSSLLKKYEDQNTRELEKLNVAIEDATANLGETEVRDANLAKALFYTKIGDKEKSVSQFHLTEEKTVGSGQKLDIIFTLLRIGFFWKDEEVIIKNLERARTMVEQGSDWDRRNRLKVYDALYQLSVRNFSKAANLLLETIATFSATELMDYKTYVFYTVLMASVSLDRVTLKQKVIDAPEVLSVIDEIPNLKSLMNSLHECSYSQFFVSLAEVSDTLKFNEYLSSHSGFYCKEMRIRAYAQLLESYRSVQIENMAQAFGVTSDFIDREISRFIASGRLHCKIDKVGGIIETNRTDSKNTLYQTTIKSGDHLLNRVQKLSRVINL